MALQDLTPQLRTRLSRVERVVGLFVVLATLLMIAGFTYYLYATAKRKGWFVEKVHYFTFVDSTVGFVVGSPVKLMGFDAGEITKIEPMPPGAIWNVYIEFQINDPYFGYIWTDSRVKVNSADLLGNRFLEVTKGGLSGKKVEASYRKNPKTGQLEMWIDPEPEYDEPGQVFRTVEDEKARLRGQGRAFKGYLLIADEAPAITDRLQRVIAGVEQALPGILNLTNHITAVLTNSNQLVVRLEDTLRGLQPTVTNVAAITDNLRNPRGSLGEWLLPVPLQQELQDTLASVHGTVRTADTQVSVLSSNLNRTLANLADLTGNLKSQVQANSLILSEISSLVVTADEFLQGLKRNWLLKASFAPTTNAPVESVLEPSIRSRP